MSLEHSTAAECPQKSEGRKRLRKDLLLAAANNHNRRGIHKRSNVKWHEKVSIILYESWYLDLKPLSISSISTSSPGLYSSYVIKIPYIERSVSVSRLQNSLSESFQNFVGILREAYTLPMTVNQLYGFETSNLLYLLSIEDYIKDTWWNDLAFPSFGLFVFN